MTAISYHETIKELQGFDWFDAGPFARLQWFALLEEAGAQPFVALASNGAQAQALALTREGRRASGLTNWYAFTWSDLRTSPAGDTQLLTTLAKYLTRHFDRIDLEKLPLEDGTCERLQYAFRKAGWVVLAQPHDINHFLILDGRSYTQYLASRPGKLRTTLKRKTKRVETRIATEFSETDWQHYEAIYAESWKGEEGDPAMLRRFAETESAAGRYRLGLALFEGEPVAAQFWCVDGAAAYIHKLAHRESAKPLSAGTTLTAALFEHVIDIDKVSLVDFGTGNDAYKPDWMDQQRDRWQLTCLRPGAIGNWPILSKALARKLVSAFPRR